MNYLSVCSGIEAATQAWHPLDWQPVAFSEIDKFPSAVLAYHYPNVPNWGDMTNFKEWPDATVDVLVGGTPCQSFSVAGLRKGLADPRGNLALTFLAITEKYKPEFVVWENVPGAVSDSTGAFEKMVTGFNELGYAVECDILDAQYFGLAQRRRRVFLVCHSIAIGRKKKTQLFANAAAQCLHEILLSVLAAASEPSKEEGAVSEWPARLGVSGVQQKMRLFGLPSEKQKEAGGIETWLENLHSDLIEALEQSGRGQMPSESSCGTGGNQVGGTQGEKSSAGQGRGFQSLSTGPSWRPISDALLSLLSTSTTLTATETTTTSTIYTCARACLSIAQSIIRSTNLPESCFDGDGSGLTALKEFTRYARQADSDLFGNIDGLCDWSDFIAQAEGAIRELESGRGDRACTGAVLLESHAVQGDSPPCNDTRVEVSRTLTAANPLGRGDGHPLVADGGRVRFATPVEWERMMGFPDNFTRIPWRGKPAEQCPDGPRYKALGNSMAVNCMSWLGQRIQMVSEL